MLSKVDIFDIRNNSVWKHNSAYRLWIALKSWYLWYSEQHENISDFVQDVVNCSQKLISLIFGTTRLAQSLSEQELWIALKSWYLWYSEQQVRMLEEIKTSCELLSKVDIFDIRNNTPTRNYLDWSVVNCSQKLISLIFGTTFYFF